MDALGRDVIPEGIVARAIKEFTQPQVYKWGRTVTRVAARTAPQLLTDGNSAPTLAASVPAFLFNQLRLNVGLVVGTVATMAAGYVNVMTTPGLPGQDHYTPSFGTLALPAPDADPGNPDPGGPSVGTLALPAPPAPDPDVPGTTWIPFYKLQAKPRVTTAPSPPGGDPDDGGGDPDPGGGDPDPVAGPKGFPGLGRRLGETPIIPGGPSNPTQAEIRRAEVRRRIAIDWEIRRISAAEQAARNHAQGQRILDNIAWGYEGVSSGVSSGVSGVSWAVSWVTNLLSNSQPALAAPQATPGVVTPDSSNTTGIASNPTDPAYQPLFTPIPQGQNFGFSNTTASGGPGFSNTTATAASTPGTTWLSFDRVHVKPGVVPELDSQQAYSQNPPMVQTPLATPTVVNYVSPAGAASLRTAAGGGADGDGDRPPQFDCAMCSREAFLMGAAMSYVF
jgi:hypothetical protein